MNKFCKNLFSLILVGLTFILFTTQIFAQDQTVTMSLFDVSYNVSRDNMTSQANVFIQLKNNTGKSISQMKIYTIGQNADSVAWQQYSAVFPWIFTPPDGQKPIYAQFQTSTGELIPAAATFVYDTTPPNVSYTLENAIIGKNSVNVSIRTQGQDTWSVTEYDYRLTIDEPIEADVWRDNTSNIISVPVFSEKYSDGAIIPIRFQSRDAVGNVSQVITADVRVDKTPPVVYVESLQPSDGLNAEVAVYPYDEYSWLEKLEFTNDPTFVDGIVSMPIQEKYMWYFDDRRVGWVRVTDSLGNVSEPHPFYLPPKTITTGTATITPPLIPTLNPTYSNDPKFKEFQEKIVSLEKSQKTLEEQTESNTQQIQQNSNLLQKIIEFLKNLFPFWE